MRQRRKLEDNGMTRNQFRKKCKAEKVKGYQLLWVGEIVAAIGGAALLAGILLGNNGIVSFDLEITLMLAGLVLAVAGAVCYIIGEAIATKAVKSHSSGSSSVHFSKVKRQSSYSLENQNGRIEKFSDADICNYLEDMFLTPDQFVTLTAPKAKDHVRFVQACMLEGYVELQLGLEGRGTKLIHKRCSKEECRRVFLEFYRGQFVPNQYEYQPL